MKAQEMFEQLTLKEKAELLTGKKNWWFEGIPRLGIRDFFVADGPHGLRAYEDPQERNGHPKKRAPATAFPCAAAMGATFHPELIVQVGETIGKECNHYGVDVILGPGVDGKRSPLGGRNFEYYSEDPYLSAQMGIAFVKGAQSQGIGTSVKHFVLNEQETARRFISSNTDVRTLRELYAYPFEQIVKQAQPLTIMGSYNKVNGTYACENRDLITDLLRKEWGYQGIVISDWGGVQNKRASVEAGLDIEMPESEWKQSFVEDVLQGKYDLRLIDETVKRILSVYEILLNNKNHLQPTSFEKNHVIANEVAKEAIVLLKNQDGILPLNPKQNLVIIGPYVHEPRAYGGGSSELRAYKIDTPQEAFEQMGSYTYVTQYQEISSYQEAITKADAVLVFTGTTPAIESEGFDRSNLFLPQDQIECVNAVAKWNQQVIVVNSSGSAVDFTPIDSAMKGLLQSWFLGSASGYALVDILFGKINPSGKCSETFPLCLEHTPAYPYFPEHVQSTTYHEGLLSGYRHYDTHHYPVRYPFGFGLSYTTFVILNAKVDRTSISKKDHFRCSITVKNTGKIPGAEVIQLYVSKPDSEYVQPHKVLRRFEKVFLQPGEERTVTWRLDASLFETFIPKANQFLVESGRYVLMIGTDVQTISQQIEMHVSSSDDTSPQMDDGFPAGMIASHPKYKQQVETFFKDLRPIHSWEREEPFRRIVYRRAKEYHINVQQVEAFLEQLFK